MPTAAAVGLVQLRRLDDMLARRRWLASRYSEQLRGLPWLNLPAQPSDRFPNFQSYMVRLAPDAPVTRDHLMQQLLDRGISTRRGIMAIHREVPYREAKWDAELPVTNRVTDSAIILPLHYAMTEADQDYVIDCITQIAAAPFRSV